MTPRNHRRTMERLGVYERRLNRWCAVVMESGWLIGLLILALVALWVW